MLHSPDSLSQVSSLQNTLQDARAAIAAQFLGQEHVVSQVLTTLLCGGHGLLVGPPGLGKTKLVDTLSTVMGLTSNRVQFTPDLMPSDILGSEVLDTTPGGERHFRFIKGPIFCQMLMADEINRASPRTQSALLQAMQEHEVTIANNTYPLGKPFHVFATQNPIEQEGTYPLPEAQLDRFLLEITLPYPDRDTERDILLATTGTDTKSSAAVFTERSLQDAQQLVRAMPVGAQIVDMILTLTRNCRPDENAPQLTKDYVEWGPGPRAAQALMLSCRAHALLNGRLAPSIEDLRDMAVPVLNHRISLNFNAHQASMSKHDFIQNMIAQTLPECTSSPQ